ARPASFTPIQVPPPTGSTGNTASRFPHAWLAGGSAGGRSRRSSRLHATRKPPSHGTIVTVHIRNLAALRVAVSNVRTRIHPARRSLAKTRGDRSSPGGEWCD